LVKNSLRLSAFAVKKLEMKKLVYHIMYRALGILLGMLAVASAAAQKPVQIIEVDQCDVIEIGVQEFPGDRYIWDLYTDPGVDFAQVDGDPDLDKHFEQDRKVAPVVRIHDLPHGTYFLRIMVWDDEVCTNNLLVFQLIVNEVLPTAEFEADPFCFGDYNEVRITLTGRGPWVLTYAWDENNEQTVTLAGNVDPIYYLPIPIMAPGQHSLWVMEVKDECSVNTYEVPKEIPFIIHSRPRTSRIYLKPDEEEEQKP
jgi:hypothetical protein